MQGTGRSRNQSRVVVPVAATGPAPPYHLPSSRHVAGGSATSGRRTAGPCFACGEMGHLRASCPSAAADSGRKWYPLQEGVVVYDSSVDEIMQ